MEKVPDISPLSRRAFLGVAGALPFAVRRFSAANVPVGIELYTVRDELAKDLMGTVRAVVNPLLPIGGADGCWEGEPFTPLGG
jgi:hypothetical protein